MSERFCLCFFQAILLLTVTFGSSAYAAVPDRVYQLGPDIPKTYNHLVQILGAESVQAGSTRLTCVRRASPTVAAAVVGVAGVGPNGLRSEFPYAVVIASYTTTQEANEVLKAARKEFDYAALARCLGVQVANIPNAIENFKRDTFIIELQEPSAKWRRLDIVTPPPAFNGIGSVTSSSDNKPRLALIEGRRYAAPRDAAAAVASYHGQYPDVRFAAIKHGSFFYVAVTSLVGDEGLKAATHAMRKRGAYRLAVSATFKPMQTNLIVDSSVRMFSVDGKELPELPPLTQLGERLVTYVLEPVDLFESVADRTRRCLATGNFVTASRVENLASCTGVVMNSAMMTRCLAGSDCQGVRVPIGFKEKQEDLLRTCLGLQIPGEGGNDAEPIRYRDPMTACQATTLDPSYREFLGQVGLISCLRPNGAASQSCTDARKLLATLCDQSANKVLCDIRREVVGEFSDRFASIERCLNRSDCGLVVPRPPELVATLVQESQRLGTTLESRLTAEKEAFGVLTGDAAVAIERFKKCVALRDAGPAQAEAARNCFVQLGMSAKEQELSTCFIGAPDVAARTQCISSAAGEKFTNATKKAECARSAGTDPTKLATCVGGDTQRISEAYQCALKSETALDAALQCTGQQLSPVLAGGIVCVKNVGQGGTPQAYLACLDNLGKNEQVAICVANAKSQAEQVACLTSLISLDPKLAQSLGCLARSNGDTQAMAACAVAPYLPPEVALAADCAAKSTGATDFALCASGSGLNPEFRIAAECAVSTGGEPISFASCTAGRLTARELTKCMSGTIGQEGGCFGPNNDLVKAFKNQINDLLNGPGAGNDLVKLVEAFAPVASAINQIGGNISRELQSVGDHAKRGDVGRVVCGWIGC